MVPAVAILWPPRSSCRPHASSLVSAEPTSALGFLVTEASCLSTFLSKNTPVTSANSKKLLFLAGMFSSLLKETED